MMQIPDYQTIKFEHQERIDKAAHYRAANEMTRSKKQTNRRPPKVEPTRRRSSGWGWAAAFVRRLALT